MKKGISILGSTGSIGRQTLEVVSAFPGKFTVTGLSAASNLESLAEQIKKFSPRLICVEMEEDAKKLISMLGKTTTTIYFGPDGLNKIAKHKETDILAVAIPGIAGLIPTLQAIASGKTIALASKEVLVSSGDLVMAEAKKRKVRIYPLDSEHSAIAQCLKNEDIKKVKRVILTASGGPFLKTGLKDLAAVAPEQALGHPTWKMGKRITIDSATLMNKGFEVIEAHHLFGLDYSKIEVVIHPQSVIHSLVEFEDGSLMAQLGAPDMRIPIQYALLGFERLDGDWAKLDLAKTGTLSFERVDKEKFPCIDLAYHAGGRGGTLPAVLQAADEAAVDLFLSGKIKFTDIHKLIKGTMDKHETIDKPTLEDIIAADKWARDEIKILYC